MIIAEFEVTVAYTQIVVFVSGMTPPALDWTDDHVAQGFAWQPTIASFGVPDHDGMCMIRVEVVDQIEVDPKALWAVRVPFDVPSVPLSIGSIFELKDVTIPEGKYSLIFEALPGASGNEGDHAFNLSLKFLKDQNPDFQIIRRGTELTTDTVLRKGL